MSDQRVALYVYDQSPVTIAPNDGPVDIYRMTDDYSGELVETVAEPTKLVLEPGVYGYAYRDKHGLTVDPAARVNIVVDLQKKKPWPQPPPPPPPPYLARRDWNEHTATFMAPLAFDDGTEGEPAAGG